MAIYTRKGDSGKTTLPSGARVEKDDIIIEVYGNLDELNSYLGLLISLLPQGVDGSLLLSVQDVLFAIGSSLLQEKMPEESLSQLTARMEQEIDAMQADLPAVSSFILPGGTTPASLTHVCRTVCRRCERVMVTLNRQSGISSPDVLSFLNRFSDYLFVLARKINIISDCEEKILHKTCK